jgi:hypothetical protein
MRQYKSIDRTGQVFGHLTVIELVPTIHGKKDNKKWLCRCECGVEKIIRVDHLVSGETISCGCKKLDLLKEKSTTHGLSQNNDYKSEYLIWVGMKRRCFNKGYKKFIDYGGRGITVCERWTGANGFLNFIKDMGKKPTQKHSLDRWPNNDGNYEPDNCRWATMAEQNRNKRDNHWIEFEGKKMVLLDWAKHLNIERHFLYRLLKKHVMDVVVQMINNGTYRTRKKRTTKATTL